MTFTYVETDLSTDLAKVRRLIADTSRDDALFSDEELDWFISEGGGVYMAAALATRAIAASKALVARKYQIGDYSEDFGDIVKSLHAQADQWEARSASTTAATVAVTRVDGYSSTVASNAV